MRKLKLKDLMVGLQSQMDAKLSLSRSTLTHSGTIGDFSELEWLALLGEYLPKRYSVDKGFVVDAAGNVSDQIDVIVYDRHYTPFVFHQNGAKYIPAEAVYAVFECKQDITIANIRYAAKKARSVRRLKRTSKPIVHAGGTAEPKKLHAILAGLICVGGQLSTNATRTLKTAPQAKVLNFVCSLNGTFASLPKFEPWSKNVAPHKLATSNDKLSLVRFVMTLISDLQKIGTVPAIDVVQYLPKN